MVANLNTKRAIEIYMIDEEFKFFHAGHCKVLIDLVAKALIIKNYDIDILKFQVPFNWQFVRKHHILCCFAPASCDKFILVFKNPEICLQIYDVVSKNKLVNHLANFDNLLEQRFLIPVLETLQTNKDRATKLQELINEFIEVLDPNEKRTYLEFLRKNNFYYGLSFSSAGEEEQVEIPYQSGESSVKEEYSNVTEETGEYDWERASSPTSALVMNVVQSVSRYDGSLNGDSNEGMMESYDVSYGNSPQLGPSSMAPRNQLAQLAQKRNAPLTVYPHFYENPVPLKKPKSYAGSIDNILSGRKTQIKRYKQYLANLTGPNLSRDQIKKREEYKKSLAIIRITLVKATLQRDLNTFIKKHFGNDMRNRLLRSNFTFDMAREILDAENLRNQKLLWSAFQETMKDNRAFWERVVSSQDEWNRAFNPCIKLNTELYEQEIYHVVE